MKAVIQRVKSSSVSVDGKLINKIDKGFNILLGINVNDTHEDIDYLARKILNLRIFDDENGVMNKSVMDIGGSILSISQFTLYADTKKGNRPSYINALGGEEAIKLYDKFNEELRKYVNVETGSFGAEMKVSIYNDGPITIMLEK